MTELADRILAAIARNTSKRPARAADVLAIVGGPEPEYWAALDALLRGARIHTAHIMRPAKGETTPWLAIWPTGIYMPPTAWTGAHLSSLFVPHDRDAAYMAHAPRSRPLPRSGVTA